MVLRTEQKLPIILLVVFVILTTVGILFFQSTESLRQAIESDRKTSEFLYQADKVQAMCLDSANAVRGFMFVSSDTYLDPFIRSKSGIPRAMSELRQLAPDDPKIRADLDHLERVLGEFIREMDRKVEQRKILGFEESLQDVYTPEDKPRMDVIRSKVQGLSQAVSSRQQTRDRAMEANLNRTVWILIVSSIAGALALALANFVVHREIKKRRSAENALTDANRGLEEKVAQRTEELQVLNYRLLEIGDERERLLIQESRSRQEAEIANRLRDEFMATVSHELRTPLNSILGWARLLKDGGLSDQQSSRALSTIIKNSETQNRLIEDLLDVARLISGKLELDRENVDIIESVHESIEISRPALEPKALRVHIDDGDRRPIVYGDRNRLRQVFSNLVTNAIKFSHEGGEIHVSVSQVDGFVVLKFRDEGVGISEEFLPLVFERFRQDASVEKRNGGLGLGLAIVRNLVEMHGGTVAVHSEGSDTGAEFTVRLPVINPE